MRFLKRYLSAFSSNLKPIYGPNVKPIYVSNFKPIYGPHQTQGKLQLLVDLSDGLRDSEDGNCILVPLSLNAYQFYQVFLFHPTFKNYQGLIFISENSNERFSKLIVSFHRIILLILSKNH
jgi:hypothetical protein